MFFTASPEGAFCQTRPQLEINKVNLKTKIKIVSKPDLDRLHEKSLQVLSETGVIFHREEPLEIFKQHGTKVRLHNRRFPQSEAAQ